MAHPDFLTGPAVAAVFGVDLKTVHNWDASGKLKPTAHTPGGHRRYDVTTVVDMAKGLGWPVSAELEARAAKARAEAAA